MIKLLYVSAEDIGKASAARSHVTGLTEGLRQAGLDVTVVAPEKTRPGFFGRIIRIAECLNQARRNLGDKDILYVRAHPLILPLIWLANLKNCPVFHEVNGRDVEIFIKHKWALPVKFLLLWMQRRQFRTADGIAAVTPGLAGWIAGLRGVKAPVAVISNGVDIRLFQHDLPRSSLVPANDYVLFFGNFSPWHGIANLLEAIKNPAWPAHISLVFVGDGADAELARQAASTDSRIVKLPRLEHVELVPIILHALGSLVVLRNIEGKADCGLAPLKLFESMAAGIPVIASNLPYMVELVTAAEAGIIVPEQDPMAVAEAVALLASDPRRAKELGANGYRAILNFHGWGIRGRELAAFFAECTAASSPMPENGR